MPAHQPGDAPVAPSALHDPSSARAGEGEPRTSLRAPQPMRPGLTAWTALAAIVSVAGTVMLGGCSQAQEGEHGGAGGPPPAPVTVQAAVAADRPATFEYVGQTAGAREVEVRARVSGILLQRRYTEGAAVRRGQTLYSLDAAPYQVALRRADADLAAARARQSQAARTLARLKPLFEGGATAQRNVDDALAAEEVARADVLRGEALRAEAALNLSYASVTAPIGGVASRSRVSEGTLVSGPELLLTTITQTDPIKVRFGIADTDLMRWREEAANGQLKLPANQAFDIELVLADGRTYHRQGKLLFSDARVSQTTGTVEAEAELPNPDGALLPGQFVRVRLLGAVRPKAIQVPARAVLEGPQGKFVYVVADGKAMPKPVQVGEQTADGWIVSQGLAAGDPVIVDGMARIFFPGAPVVAAPPAGASAPAAGAQKAAAAPASGGAAGK